jgi:hypothetical protein
MGAWRENRSRAEFDSVKIMSIQWACQHLVARDEQGILLEQGQLVRGMGLGEETLAHLTPVLVVLSHMAGGGMCSTCVPTHEPAPVLVPAPTNHSRHVMPCIVANTFMPVPSALKNIYLRARMHTCVSTAHTQL